MYRLFEPRSQKPLSQRAFLIRMGKYILTATLLLFVALGAGMIGYHFLENMNWLDSFLNAAMILGGMGPVDELKTDGGKLFAGVYALFSGLIFLVVVGLVFGPLVHRLLHKFHFDFEPADDNR